MGLGNLAVLCLGATVLFAVACVFVAVRRIAQLTRRLEHKPTQPESDKVLDPILYAGLIIVVTFWGSFAVVAALGTQFGILHQ